MEDRPAKLRRMVDGGAATQCIACKAPSLTNTLCPLCTDAALEHGDKALPPPTVVRMKRVGERVVQDCDVYIGRRWTFGGWDLPQSKWANPFTVKKSGSVEKAVKEFRQYLRTRPDLMDQIRDLGGKTLGCWCKPGPCHGDVLVALYKELVGHAH